MSDDAAPGHTLDPLRRPTFRALWLANHGVELRARSGPISVEAEYLIDAADVPADGPASAHS